MCDSELTHIDFEEYDTYADIEDSFIVDETVLANVQLLLNKENEDYEYNDNYKNNDLNDENNDEYNNNDDDNKDIYIKLEDTSV